MTLTAKQRTVLARMGDSEWYLGADLGSTAILSILSALEMIRDDMQRDEPMVSRLWTITPDGLTALEAAQ